MKALEDVRHEEKVNITMFNLNKENLDLYSTFIDQQEPAEQERLNPQKEKIGSLINHMDESLKEIREKSKLTVEQINDAHDEILLLKQHRQVSEYIAKEVATIEKIRKRVDESRRDDNGRIQKRSRSNIEAAVESRDHLPDSESSESECEEEETDVLLDMAIEADSRKKSNDDDEEEAISEIDINYEDREVYENVQCGEKDDSILPGSRIQVYWKGDKCWYKGTVVGWDENRKLYLINYDNEEDLEPMGEHLTGPSKEKWEYARATRKYRTKTTKALEMDVCRTIILINTSILSILSHLQFITHH